MQVHYCDKAKVASAVRDVIDQVKPTAAHGGDPQWMNRTFIKNHLSKVTEIDLLRNSREHSEQLVCPATSSPSFERRLRVFQHERCLLNFSSLTSFWYV